MSLHKNIETTIREKDKIEKGGPNHIGTGMKMVENRTYRLIKGIKSPEEAPDLQLATMNVPENSIETKDQDKDVGMTKGTKSQEIVVITITNREEETTMRWITERTKKDILKNTPLKEGKEDLTTMMTNIPKEDTMIRSAFKKMKKILTEEKINLTMMTMKEGTKGTRMKGEEKVLTITKETETDTVNKITTEDKDMKSKEAQALEKTNIRDPIEKDKTKEGLMMTGTGTHKEGIEKITKGKEKEIAKEEEAEAEKKALINTSLTEEIDMKRIHPENKVIAMKESIPEVADTLEAQE